MTRAFSAREWMIFIICGIALISTLAYLSSSSSRLEASETARDFGERRPGEVLSHEFLLVQRGFWPPRVTSVSSSCGCLDARVKLLNGRYYVEIRMELPANSGLKEAIAFVNTSDPNDPVREFKMTARVVPPVELSPRFPSFGDVRREDAAVSQLSVSLTPNPRITTPIDVTIVDPMGKSQVHVVTRARADKVVLGLSTEPDLGPVSAVLQVTFGDGGPFFNVPLRGRIIGPVIVSPEELFLVWDDLSRPLRARVLLRARDSSFAGDAKLDRLLGDLENQLSCRVDSRIEGGSSSLRIEFGLIPKPRAGTRYRGGIRILTSDRIPLIIPVAINGGGSELLKDRSNLNLAKDLRRLCENRSKS